VKGKIVLCDAMRNGCALLLAGAIGAVMRIDLYTDYASTYPLPTTLPGSLVGGNVAQYINTRRCW